jgi:hypothetical protein
MGFGATLRLSRPVMPGTRVPGVLLSAALCQRTFKAAEYRRTPKRGRRSELTSTLASWSAALMRRFDRLCPRPELARPAGNRSAQLSYERGRTLQLFRSSQRSTGRAMANASHHTYFSSQHNQQAMSKTLKAIMNHMTPGSRSHPTYPIETSLDARRQSGPATVSGFVQRKLRLQFVRIHPRAITNRKTVGGEA